MAEKSFWSSIPGMITGIAGLLTGAAALLGLLLQLGVIGDKDKTSNTETTSPAEGDGSTQSSVATAPTFSVSPTAVNLDQLLAKESKVTVKNTGEASFEVDSPVLRGGDAAQFAVRDLGCTGTEIGPGDSCEMMVTFTPKAGGRYSATLVVSVSGAAKPSEVALRGAAAL